MRENTNPGWVARIGDTTLPPVIVDGWQQAWIVPAGLSGPVVLEFAPDGPYRIGLAIGAASLLVVVGLAVVPPRRRAGSASAVMIRPGAGLGLAVVTGGAALVVVGGLLGGVVVVVTLGVIAMRLADAYDRRRVDPGPKDERWVGIMRRLRRSASWLPAALLGIGGLAWIVVSGAHRDVLPQVAGILAVAALWTATVLTGRLDLETRGRGHGG
jgi:arabinofuranan 3-O-arabinosyltransferase